MKVIKYLISSRNRIYLKIQNLYNESIKYDISSMIRKRLLAGTVPVNNSLLTGTEFALPTDKM